MDRKNILCILETSLLWEFCIDKSNYSSKTTLFKNTVGIMGESDDISECF